ncbi:Hachiman antiphage defense system protein HamA [Cohnella suwonensis]|uniref:Hachiman antiphage defense system protein HamA n=1 Tax=Cohnella suwonensis TaxID=696072 RepID=A0ABW0M1Y7_9BACL
MPIAIVTGIRFQRRNEFAICHIDHLSNEIKEVIRNQLSAVCYGLSKAASVRKTYNYKNTLKEFLKRYDSKSSDTKLGMIGELLTHILIFQFFTEFNAVSPYFNLEERSIKKGFDVILYSRGKKELWITEVKSGERHQNKNAGETIITLLGTAKRDLEKRLNENEVTFWENAINGATTALANKKDMKDAVMDILGEIGDEVAEERAKSTDKNVILVASLFASLTDEIKEYEVNNFTGKLSKDKPFKNVIVFSIQKATYQNVVDFLREEAK